MALGCRGLGIALLSALLVSSAVCDDSFVKTVPTFVWGSCKHLDSISSSKVSYQTVPSTRLVGEVLESLSASSDATEKPEIVLIVLGNQLPVKQLPSLAEGALKPLRQFLDKAAASLSLPFAQFTESDSLHSKLSKELSKRSDGKSISLVDTCGDDATNLKTDIVTAIKQTTAEFTVVIVCNKAQADLEQDMSILSQAVEAVESTNKKYLTMYTANTAVQVQRRSLAEQPLDDPEPYVCDDTCKAQVRVLEAAILALILLVAIGAGTWFMSAVDTPTRYETSKEKHTGGME